MNKARVVLLSVLVVMSATWECPAATVVGLENHYTFDNQASPYLDASPNARHATNTGTVWVNDPVMGGVVEFDSADVIAAAVPQMPASGFTVSFWAYRGSNASSGNDGLFVLHDGNTGNKNVAGWVGGSDVAWGRVRDTGDRNLSNTSVSAAIPDTRWVYLTYRGTGSEYQLLINGGLASTVAYSGAALRTTNTLNIGRQGTESWRGMIDDFRIYNRALSDLEIHTIMSEASMFNPAQARVDIGSSVNNGGGPGGVQYGFLPMEAAEGGSNPPVTQSLPVSFGQGAGGTMTATLSGYTHFRDYTAITGDFAASSALLSDMALRNSSGTMTLALSDLPPGFYQLKTYHHSDTFAGASFDVSLSDAGRPGWQSIATGLVCSTGTSPTAVTTVDVPFAVLGAGTASLNFAATTSSSHFSFNGFELDSVVLLERHERTLAVDFNDRSAAGAGMTQAGFSEFLLAGSGAVTRTIGAHTLTLTPAGASTFDDRARTTPVNSGAFTQDKLLRDFVFVSGTAAADGLDLLIQGLGANELYEVTLWAFDTGSGGGRSSDWFANGVLVADNYSFNGAVLPTSNDQYAFSFLAYADEDGELLLAGRAAGGSNPNVFLNALELTRWAPVPEPATLLLAGLGLASLGRYARRRRAEGR
ncbi:MAG TPA: LamG domain-containing protein [Phycisphaerae bacterium]|nr:LamG domain-containing protein [Phycisphaerae bacterium]